MWNRIVHIDRPTKKLYLDLFLRMKRNFIIVAYSWRQKKNKTKRNENIKCKEFCLSPVVRDSYILLFDLLETSGRGHAMLIHFPPCVWIVIQFSMEENQPIALWFFTLAWASYGNQNGISAVSAVNGNIAASIRSISTMHITYVPEMGEDQRKTKIISFLLLFACEMSNPYILYSVFHYCHSHSGILIQHTHFLSYVPLTDLFIWVYSPFHKSGCQGMKINWRGTFAKCIYAWVWKMVVRTQGNNRQPICAYISLADWLFYLLFLFLFSFELS